MTAVRKVHLRCDGWMDSPSGCHFQLGDISSDPDRGCLVGPYGSYTVKAERAEALRVGWTRVGKLDFCPPCTERRKATS